MRRMFPRQLLMTIGLLLLTLLVLSFFFQAVFYQYTVGSIKENLYSTADAVESMMRVTGVSSARNNDLWLRFQLNYTARAAKEDLVVCDSQGIVTACSCGVQNCEHLGYQLDVEKLQQTDNGDYIFSSTLATGLYGSRRLAVVVPIWEQNSYAAGYVMATADYADISKVMQDAIHINVITLLIVLPLSILVVYLLVRRQLKPIRELTNAAKRLGHGQMSARVPTGGNNAVEINDLAIAFNNMAQALEQSETKRQEFVANVSHELKTPMTTISGYMDGMLDGTIPLEQQRKYMQVISDEVKRLSRLVRSMLEISRLQDQGIPPEQMRPFDICGTIGQVLISFEQKINGKHLEVETKLPPQGAQAMANPDAIAQVIYNLIDNGVKFCQEQGKLTVGIAETKNSKYLVTVTNTGATIPPEELPLVFDRFHKADKSRSVDRDGWGLGLYIVRTIICSHGEDIFVTSRNGETTFSFTLRKA